MFGRPYRVEDFIRVLFGNFSTKLVDFADAVTPGLSAANKDTVLVIRLYGG